MEEEEIVEEKEKTAKVVGWRKRGHPLGEEAHEEEGWRIIKELLSKETTATELKKL